MPSGHLFNYKETVQNFKHDEDIENAPCYCQHSKFADGHHGHVVTGNLMIIENKKLRELFRKGPNYREKQTMNWGTAVRSLKEDVSSFIKKWSSKVSKPVVYFSEWKYKFLKILEQKGKLLRKKIKCRPVKKVLQDPECVKNLEELKNKYVLVPIDKASNNIGFICKRYFLQVLLQETHSASYNLSQDTVEEVINDVTAKCQTIGVEVDMDNKELPQIYATIKMHKDPVKFRFIIGSRKCVTKQVAKKLVKILQLIMKIHRRYCDKIKYYTGIERYWIVDNNSTVLEHINHINTKQNAKSVQTFDFSTLYTKIPLEDLKEKLKNIVDKAFKGGTNQYIKLTQQEARWHHCKKKDTFTKEDIHNMIDIIIDNSFFRFGDKVYRQCIGIPMGIDPAPQMANLYLYYYESSFMEKLTKDNYGIAKKFNNTSRYIDDLITLNNNGNLMNFMNTVYPQELILNLENDNDQQATFLDLDIKIQDNKFQVKTYDKRDAFNFEIVSYPDLSENIPMQPAYGVFTSQVIRHARICNTQQDLADRVQLLIKKLIKKNYTTQGIKSAIRKCFRNHQWIRQKLENPSKLLDGWSFS